MLKAKLVVVGGNAKAKEVRLRLPTIIGRGKEADLTIPHALVSRSHSKLFERDGQLCVKDLGSLNGTFVDNKRIESEQIIAPNQLLTLGDITFRAIYEIDRSSTETLPSQLPESTQTICVNPAVTKPLAPKVSADYTSDSRSGDELMLDNAATSLPRSVISEIDSFDPDEIGPLDAPSTKNASPAEIESPPNQPLHSSQTVSVPTQPITAPHLSALQAPSSGTAETPINLGSSSSTNKPPIEQISAINIDLPDDNAVSPVSFVGKIQTDDDSPSLIDDFQINLGSEAPPEVSVDESQLGSFLKKFPK